MQERFRRVRVHIGDKGCVSAHVPSLEAWSVTITDPELKDKFQQLYAKLGPVPAGTPSGHAEGEPSRVTAKKDEYNSLVELQKDLQIVHSFASEKFTVHLVADENNQDQDMHVVLENRIAKRQVPLEKGLATLWVGDGTFQDIRNQSCRYPLKLHSLANASSKDLQQIAEKETHLLFQSEAGNNLYSLAQ